MGHHEFCWKGKSMLIRKSLLLAIGGVLVLSATVSAKEIAIIVGKNHPLTRLTVIELAEIYRGQEEVVKGVRINPLDHNDAQDIRSAFLNKVMRMNPEVYINYWNHRLFQEGGTPPLVKTDAGEVIRTVREKEGAIGYIWSSETAGLDDIRVILTIEIP